MPVAARAFWITGRREGEIRSQPLSVPSPGDVVVRALFSGISRGTEALVFDHRVPPSEFQRMRAPFQEGEFPAPIKYGYSSVGVVEQGPTDLVGRHVFALYPHQTRYIVPQSAVHLVPADVPPERAILAANLETAINAMWDGGAQVGDRIAVVGGGTVGCLVAWVAAHMAGSHVQLVDVNPRREVVARALGFNFATPGAAARDADLVVHASGTAAGLECAIGVAGFEATIVELSWYGDSRVSVPLGSAFHSRRLTLKSSQVGTIPPLHRGRWTTGRRLELALSLLGNPSLECLITGESAFEDLPNVMVRLAEEPGDTLMHRIRYEES